jgi:uncharacterized protein YndB with AHSA1/START domain
MDRLLHRTGRKEVNMTKESRNVSNFPNRDLTIMREIDAPRGRVFESWINPKHVAEWWGPEGFSNPHCEMDVRPGGEIRIETKAPDGTVYNMGGFFEEIEKPERVVFSSSALDSLGHPLFDVLNTVSFESRGDKTGIALQLQVLRTTDEGLPYLEGMETGWKQCLGRLNAYVKKMPDTAKTS